jgi:hypothetical protein
LSEREAADATSTNLQRQQRPIEDDAMGAEYVAATE